jgi:hypothetical protein
LLDIGEFLEVDKIESTLRSDYERQRWEDFVDRFYCADYAQVLPRLSCCIHYLPEAPEGEEIDGSSLPREGARPVQNGL